MDPEQRLPVVIEYLAVEILVLIIGALTWCLLPERMDIGDGNRALVDLYHVLRRLDLDRLLAALSVILFTSHRIMMNRPDDNVVLLHLVRLHFLVFLRRILLAQEDFNRHEAAVALQHLTHAIFIGKFQIVLIQMKGHAGTDLAVVAIANRVGVSAITLPVNRFRILLIAQRIDRDHVGHHEYGIKAQSEMSDDVILVRLILIFFKKCCRTGKCNLGDVLLHFLSGHTETGIDEFHGLLIRIDKNPDRILELVRILIFSHHLQLVQLRYSITAVGYNLPYENVLVAVQPLLDNRQHVLAVD